MSALGCARVIYMEARAVEKSIATSEPNILKGGIMSTPTKSEYMLLFRGTDWHKGLSPEEIQQVVNQMKAWLDRLTAEGKAKAGKPLFHEGRIVSPKKRPPGVRWPVCRIEGSDRGLFLA